MGDCWANDEGAGSGDSVALTATVKKGISRKGMINKEKQHTYREPMTVIESHLVDHAHSTVYHRHMTTPGARE